MKHLIITLFIAVAALSVKAQAPQQQPQEKPVMVLVPLEALKWTLNQSVNALAASNTPWSVANPIISNIQQILPMLVELKKDTVKVAPPKDKPKK